MHCKSILSLLVLAALSAACAKEEESPVVQPEAEVLPSTIEVSIPEEGLTRVSLSQDANPDGVVKLAWESSDVITVKDAADDTKSVVFAYVSGAGTATARFRAADVSALSGASSYDIYLSSHLPARYDVQTQASDGSTDHLGYSVKLGGVNKYDGVVFSPAWASANGGGTLTCSSVLRIRVQLPTHAIANAVRKVIVKSSTVFCDESNELEIAIASPGVAGDGRILTVYATLPPIGDVELPIGDEMIFQFQVSDDVHDKYTAYRRNASTMHMYEGKVNSFKINCPDIASFAGTDDDGTEEHPYLIGDRHQLDAVHTLLESDGTTYFRMIDDIDIAAIAAWEPLCLGSSENKKVYFDGGGHTISHLTVDGSTDYPSFFGFLWGDISNLSFDGADITCGGKDGGVVAGYIGVQSKQGNCSGVTIRNSTVTSTAGRTGALGSYVRKSVSITDCHVINTTVTTSGNVAGGLLGMVESNGGCSLLDCSAERITITGGATNENNSGVGGLIGKIVGNNVSIRRCHTTGSIAGQKNCFGGLVGQITGQTTQIVNCYSTCSVTGYTFAGGLVGKFETTSEATVDHCFASGKVSSTKGYGGYGGLVGTVKSPDVSITNCVAWNDQIRQRTSSDYSSGAVVGYTHPNCVLTDNYRKPGMTFTNVYWAPSENWDHPNVNGTTAPLVRIGTDLDEANAAPETTLTDLDSSSKNRWAYHGKHCAPGTVVEPDDRLGWVSTDLGDEPDPEDDPDWSDEPTLTLAGATTVTVCDGVEYTHFHDKWEGEVRDIHIVRTTLNEHNRLGVYYNYTDCLNLDEKCNYLDALVGTNGSMACCQFVRVDDVVKHGVTDASYYIANCALTIDDNRVDIVKVDGNAGASMLPNQTVSCAGPLLVWKGTIQTYPEEGNDTDFLDNTHPRTAIGLSKDRKTVIQVVVDGRWLYKASTGKRAVGMSTALLSKLMKGLGCYKAMNFDGGGGSAMWVYGYGDYRYIVNHPHNDPYTYNPPVLRPTGSAVYIHSDLK